MVVFEFKKCCCCVDLRLGSILIGYLQLISAAVFIGIIYTSLSSGTPITFSYQGSMRASYYSSTMEKPVHNQIDYSKITTEPNNTLMVVLLSVMLLVLIVGFVFILGLLVGLHQHKSKLVKAYIYYACVCLIASVCLWLKRFATRPHNAPAAINHVIFNLMAVYFLSVIISYHNTMKNTPERVSRSD